MKLPRHLDHGGTTPHAPAVIAAMRPFLEGQANNDAIRWVAGGKDPCVVTRQVEGGVV